jgi:ribonuclease P/MRP protein subunit POP5
MVRIKNRYLLVNILYPGMDNKPVDSEVPVIVQYHQPTTENIPMAVLLKGIKAVVEHLFGDYGAGAMAGSVRELKVVLFSPY